MVPRSLGVTVVAVVAVLVALSGCASPQDNPASTDAEEDFDDLRLQATATTGVIRGIVVDERIVPVAGANVLLTGAASGNTSSDAEGRFGFSDLAPGTYFVRVTSLLHQEAQTSIEVVAGVSEPAITKVQLTRLFAQEPFSEARKYDGFVQCNQAGVYYSSAPCVTDFTGLVGGPLDGVGPCTPAGCAPELRQVQDEYRGFRDSVGPGWQTMIWEMTWLESSDTFERMGLTVSYNATQRPASHNYASVGSTNPLRVEIDVGVDHENSNSVEPELIPPEGHPDLYYFVGVRTGSLPAAVAVNQQFQLFAHYFYYGVPPTDWSFINGDPIPF